jgi:hypothetical protein
MQTKKDIKKIAVLPNEQIFASYYDNTSKEINAKELSEILEEKENYIKRWSLVGNIEIVQFYSINK